MSCLHLACMPPTGSYHLIASSSCWLAHGPDLHAGTSGTTGTGTGIGTGAGTGTGTGTTGTATRPTTGTAATGTGPTAV